MAELESELTADTRDYEDGMARSLAATKKLTEGQDGYNKTEAEGNKLKKDDAVQSIRMSTLYGDVIQTLREMSSSASQTNAQLKALGLTNSELTDGQKSFQAWTGYITGMTIPVMRGFQMEAQLSTMGVKGLGFALGGVMTGMDALNVSMAAMNAQSEEQRRILSILAGVQWGIAAAELAVGAAKAFSINPTPIGIATAATGAAIIGGGFAAIATYAASAQAAAPRAQTGPGEAWIVKRSGSVYLHEGEGVSRGGGGISGGINITVNAPGANPSSIETAVQRALERALRQSGIHRGFRE